MSARILSYQINSNRNTKAFKGNQAKFTRYEGGDCLQKSESKLRPNNLILDKFTLSHDTNSKP